MHEYTPDGAPVPSNVPITRAMNSASEKKFGIYRGWVKSATYPNAPENQSGRLEYVVNILGQDYYGVIDLCRGGGVFNNHVRIRKGVDKGSFIPVPKGEDYQEKKDGEHVWCMFIGGDSNYPIIIGSSEHERAKDNPDWKEPTEDLGSFERYEFNGIEFMVDKESNLSITHVGRKTSKFGETVPDPTSAQATIPNRSKVEFKGNGDFFVDIDDTKLKLSFIKLESAFQLEFGSGASLRFDGLLDVYNFKTAGGAFVKIDGITDAISGEVAFGDKFSVSAADGIQGETPSGTKLSMKSGAVEIEGTAAKLKLSGGKVGIGGTAAEVLDLFEQTLTKLDALLTAMQAETHPTAVGPSGPPTNLAQYTQAKVDFAAIKTTLGLIKGGI